MHHQILPIPRKPYALNWLPERLIVSHYEKDYGAAVRSLNALRDRLAVLDPSSVSPAEMRALKREELSVVGSVILHELYFVNLGGDGKIPAVVTAALEKDFGSVRQWRRDDFAAAARSLAGGPGWVVLSYWPYDGRLYNQIAIDHSHAMVGAVPILVLDMYEHAYHLEFGPTAGAYVDAFMRIIEWTVVAERLMGAAGGQRREADSGTETLPSISVEEARTFMQGEQQFQVVDARPRNYVSKDPDTMPHAVWRDPERVDEWCAQLSPEAPVFVYCAYGFEVGCRVATMLRERGFDARYIRGGLAAWYGAGGARAVRSRE